MIRSQRGSTLIEAAILATLGTTLMAALFAMSYLYFVRLWSDFQGYEAMVCALEQRRTARECSWQYKHKTRRFFPRGVEHHGEVQRFKKQVKFTSFMRFRMRWNFIPDRPTDAYPHNHDQVLRQEQRLWIPH